MTVRPVARLLAVSRVLTSQEAAMVGGAGSGGGTDTLCNDPLVITHPEPPESGTDEGKKRDSY